MQNAAVSADRPILFSAPMVRAILRGEKTQTRRIVKDRHAYGIECDDSDCFSFMHSPTCGGGCDYACASLGETVDGHIGWTPWGSHPDCWGLLWVRETFAPMPGLRPIPHPEIYDSKPAWYRADNDRPMWAGTKWTPAIHMPRSCARIILQITGVRVERLQDISGDDAIAEGVQNRREFAALWESINGPDSWGHSPWVWVVSFRRETPA